MRLPGIDGSNLFGFMAALGMHALLNAHARARGLSPPRLAFCQEDCTATLCDAGEDLEVIVRALFDGLQSYRPFFEESLHDIAKPSDFTRTTFDALARRVGRWEADVLAGLACCVGDDVAESSLCAANGAGHQALVQSIRDILSLVTIQHLQAALGSSWRKDYEVPSELRRSLKLGNRKPTLRLDPGDERLHALRATDPTGGESVYRTELGAQALAIAAFSLLPVLPMARPVSVASIRRGSHVFFAWTLWDRPATLASARSLVFAGVLPVQTLRARGAFAAFRAARVTGDKGKLSFAPTEGVW